MGWGGIDCRADCLVRACGGDFGGACRGPRCAGGNVGAGVSLRLAGNFGAGGESRGVVALWGAGCFAAAWAAFVGGSRGGFGSVQGDYYFAERGFRHAGARIISSDSIGGGGPRWRGRTGSCDFAFG